MVIGTEHNDDKRDGDASQESDFVNTGHKRKVSDKIDSDSTISRLRDAKIAKTIQIPAEGQQEPRQGIEN